MNKTKIYKTDKMLGLVSLILFISISTRLYSDDLKIILTEREKEEYSKINWSTYEWSKKWDNFVLERDFPESEKIQEYLEMERKGILPPNVHIYKNDQEYIPSYREFLWHQIDNGRDLMEIKIKCFIDNIYNKKEEMEFYNWPTFALDANPMMIDFLIDLYKNFKNVKGNLNGVPTGLCMMADAMLFEPGLFQEELLYFKVNALSLLVKDIEFFSDDDCILELLYRFGYKKYALDALLSRAYKRTVNFSNLYKEYYSFKKNIWVCVADPEIEPYVLKLLDSKNAYIRSKFQALMYLYWLGTLKDHLEYIFQIIDNKEYITHTDDIYLIQSLELLYSIKSPQIENYFRKNLNNPIFKKHQDKMLEYLKKKKEK